MIVYGYAKKVTYNERGCMQIQVRIPNIHGAYRQEDYNGKSIHNYTLDENLPYYDALELPRTPNDGDIVALVSTTEGDGASYMVIGLTGGSYNDGTEYGLGVNK